MEKEVIPIKLPNPEILEAHDTARKLLRGFSLCTDPLTKKAVKGMVYDALEYEAELRLRSRAKDLVETLHNLQKPHINSN